MSYENLTIIVCSVLEGATTLSIMTFSIMTLSVKDLHVTVSINDTQHSNVLP